MAKDAPKPETSKKPKPAKKKRLKRLKRLPKPPKPPLPPPDPAEIPLTDAERQFVDEYLIDRNAPRAYRTCWPEVSRIAARRRGTTLRNQPNVCAEIDAGVHAQTIRTRISADSALKEIARIAFSDIYELYDPATGLLRRPQTIPYETRKAIASIRVSRERRSVTTAGRTRTTVVECVAEYRLWPKMDALSKLCRHLGLDTEITPLEALLSALPRELSAEVRAALAGPPSIAQK